MTAAQWREILEEEMVEKLGAKGAAEAFVKAAEYFDANKDKEPDDERPKPMTAAQWREILEEDYLEGEGEEEECMFEGEEEEEDVDDVEEDNEEGGDGEDDADEPAAKKAKT